MEDKKMFNNISSKIKTVAKVQCFIGIAFSIILGLIYMGVTEFWDFGGIYLLISLLIAGGGSVASYISSILIYGFGELVENSNSTVKQEKDISSNHMAEEPDDKLPDL